MRIRITLVCLLGLLTVSLVCVQTGLGQQFPIQVTEEAPKEIKCATCKEIITVTKKDGGVKLEKAMECPSCKKETEELGVFQCERCGAEILSCPICRQYLEKP